MAEAENLQQFLQEAFAALPPTVQDAMRSMDLRKRFDAIREKNRLHIDQAGILEGETVNTLFGITTPDVYGENLQKNMGVSDDQLRAILRDVNEEIFLPIREAMRHASEETATATKPAEPLAAIQPAPAPAEAAEEEEHLERGHILAEIEGAEEKLLPAPAQPSVQSSTTPTSPQAAPIETPITPVAVNRPAQTVPATPISIPTAQTSEVAVPLTPSTPKPVIDIAAQKLTEPTRQSRAEVTVVPKRTPALDPYREPVA